MDTYQRNVRRLWWVVLPLLGFGVGWHAATRTVLSPHVTAEVQEAPTPDTTAPTTEETKPQRNLPSLTSLTRRDTHREVDMSLFWEAWELLSDTYLREQNLDNTEQVYGAIKGMVKSAEDPYTVFMTPEENEEFEIALGGDLEGIGAEIGFKNNMLTVVRPLKGSPAEAAGLRPGDVIAMIEEESTQGMSIYDAVRHIRGAKGTPVHITVLREGSEDPIELEIVRDTIIQHSVEWEMKGDIAYLAVSQFSTEVTREFQEAVNQIILQNPAGLILDLRNNNGGLLDAVMTISGKFFDQKTIVNTRGRKLLDSGGLISSPNGSLLEIPLIVLVNGGTASASEIFAGAVQDYRRGVLVGEQTFGKGTVQHVIPMTGGASLKVTVAEWLTPNEREINEKGITPDIVVSLTEEDWVEDRDPILDRALELMNREQMQEILALPAPMPGDDTTAEAATDEPESAGVEGVEVQK